jgi:lysozyme
MKHVLVEPHTLPQWWIWNLAAIVANVPVQQKPVLYVTDTFAKTHLDKGQLATYPLWVRDIVRETLLFNGRPWLLSQFSNRGRVPGIAGRVDQNLFAGSPAAFQRWVLQ